MKKLIGVLTVLVAVLSVAPPAMADRPAAESKAIVDAIVGGVSDDLWAQTDNYWHQGDYPRIIALDRIIVAADPAFVEPYATGAWLMESMGQISDAEAFYQLGASNNPINSYANYCLGIFYFQTVKDYAAAEGAFRHDILNCPDAGVSDWKMYAHALERERRLDDAVSVWKMIGKRWPDGPAVQTNLARVLRQQSAAQADTDKAPAVGTATAQ